MTPTEQITEKLLALQTSLTEAHPSLPVLLKEIHTTLKADPDLVTVLTEPQIQVVVEALKRQTKTEIITSAPKKPSMKNVSLDDI